MQEREHIHPPAVLPYILRESEALSFDMASDVCTGALLRTLAASKPAGRFLEIGTGTGIATAWLLAGMDQASRLITIDTNAACVAVARKYLGHDRRITFYTEDAGRWLELFSGEGFDLIFADAWPGKYSHLEQVWRLLKVGGFYVIDDMLPQKNWPVGHEQKVKALIAELEQRTDLLLTKMEWSTGIIIAVKVCM